MHKNHTNRRRLKADTAIIKAFAAIYMGEIGLAKNYSNQAFQYKSAIGLQFHLEVNEQMVNLWLDKTEEKLQQIPYIDPLKIRSDIHENISIVKSNMEIFYNNFKSVFGL